MGLLHLFRGGVRRYIASNTAARDAARIGIDRLQVPVRHLQRIKRALAVLMGEQGAEHFRHGKGGGEGVKKAPAFRRAVNYLIADRDKRRDFAVGDRDHLHAFLMRFGGKVERPNDIGIDGDDEQKVARLGGKSLALIPDASVSLYLMMKQLL